MHSRKSAEAGASAVRAVERPIAGNVAFFAAIVVQHLLSLSNPIFLTLFNSINFGLIRVVSQSGQSEAAGFPPAPILSMVVVIIGDCH